MIDDVIAFLTQRVVLLPVIIVIVALIVVKISKYLINKLFINNKEGFEKKKRNTIKELFIKIITFFIYAIAIMMILDVYGVDTNGILASLGIAGVVLGLALQSTVEDLMSGIYIIVDNYYMIGDKIKINDFLGEVVDVSLRSTKVRSASGETYIFANRNVSSVINISQSRAGVSIKIPTAYEEKTLKVENVLEDVLKEAKKIPDVFSDSKYLGIDSFESSSVNYAIIIYCKSSEQWAIKRKVLKLIKEKYEENNLKIPYDQIEVHNGKEIL